MERSITLGIVAALLVAVLLSVAPALAVNEHIQNGSFETCTNGVAAYWSTAKSEGSVFCTSTRSYQGLYSAAVSVGSSGSSGGHGYFYQNFGTLNIDYYGWVYPNIRFFISTTNTAKQTLRIHGTPPGGVSQVVASVTFEHTGASSKLTLGRYTQSGFLQETISWSFSRGSWNFIEILIEDIGSNVRFTFKLNSLTVKVYSDGWVESIYLMAFGDFGSTEWGSAYWDTASAGTPF